MPFSWNTPNKNKNKVLNSQLKVGDTVKVVNTSNEGGLNKNGRTGTITRVENNQYEVQLHCTHTGGNETKTIFIKELDRYVGLTKIKRWFSRQDLTKC